MDTTIFSEFYSPTSVFFSGHFDALKQMRVGQKTKLHYTYFGFVIFSSKKKISKLIFLQFHYFTKYFPATTTEFVRWRNEFAKG